MNEELVKKLRLTPEMNVLVLEPPAPSFLQELGLTAEVGRPAAAISADGFAEVHDFILLFVHSLADLEKNGPLAIHALKRDGLLWICYPKGTSKINTDINRDTGWQLMKTMDMEGVANVAFDDTWSAMRYRPAGAAKSRAKKSGTGVKGVASTSVVSGTTASGTTASKSLVDNKEEPVMPDELLAALAASPSAQNFFDNGLTAAMRRDFINWIIDAKREETRTKRITSMIEKLEKGLKRPADKG